MRRGALAGLVLALAGCGAGEKAEPEPRPGPARILTEQVGRGPQTAYVVRPDVNRRLPVVLFVHGWGGTLPAYRPWLDHLARRGNVVIYPRYQDSVLTPPDQVLGNLLAGVRLALRRVDTRPGGLVVAGHSAGGALAADYAGIAREARAAGAARDLLHVPRPQPARDRAQHPGDRPAANTGEHPGRRAGGRAGTAWATPRRGGSWPRRPACRSGCASTSSSVTRRWPTTSAPSGRTRPHAASSGPGWTG